MHGKPSTGKKEGGARPRESGARPRLPPNRPNRQAGQKRKGSLHAKSCARRRRGDIRKERRAYILENSRHSRRHSCYSLPNLSSTRGFLSPPSPRFLLSSPSSRTTGGARSSPLCTLPFSPLSREAPLLSSPLDFSLSPLHAFSLSPRKKTRHPCRAASTSAASTTQAATDLERTRGTFRRALGHDDDWRGPGRGWRDRDRHGSELGRC